VIHRRPGPQGLFRVPQRLTTTGHRNDATLARPSLGFAPWDSVYKVFLSFLGMCYPSGIAPQAVIKRLNAEHRATALLATRWNNRINSATGTFQEQIPNPASMTSLVFVFWKGWRTELPSAYTVRRTLTKVRSTSSKRRAIPRAARGSIARHPGLRKTAKITFDEETVGVRMGAKKGAGSVLGALVSQQHGALHRRIPTVTDAGNFEQQFELNLRDWLAPAARPGTDSLAHLCGRQHQVRKALMASAGVLEERGRRRRRASGAAIPALKNEGFAGAAGSRINRNVVRAGRLPDRMALRMKRRRAGQWSGVPARIGGLFLQRRETAVGRALGGNVPQEMCWAWRRRSHRAD